MTHLLPCLLSHRPLDLAILMLGTNDHHRGIQTDRSHLGDGVRRPIGVVQSTPKCGRGSRPPQVLVLSPVPIRPCAPQGRVRVCGLLGAQAGRRLSPAFPETYRKIAEETAAAY